MALADIFSRTRSILYGNSLGEKPAIRLAAASAAETTSNQTCTFDVASGEAAKIKTGQVLSVYDPATETDAHAFLVTSISSDTITAINGYLGAPVIVGADSGDMDNAVLEQNPLVTGFEIFEAIDTVISNQLWPWVYDMVNATITSPDLVDGQEAVAAEAEEIIHAHQIIGPTAYKIAVERIPLEIDTTIASTGKMATFDWIDGSTGYYLYRAKYLEADEADTELTHLMAVGAAALLLGGSLVATTIQGTKHDNAQAVSQRQQVGSLLWRDFLTLRQNMSEELTKRLPQQIYINRG